MHFLPHAIDVIRNHGVSHLEIPLKPLSRQAISEMIGDTVRMESVSDNFDMEALSEWVYTKTEGNAFFATRVLNPAPKYLYLLACF